MERNWPQWITGEFSRMTEISYIFIIMVTQIYTFIKTPQIVYLKFYYMQTILQWSLFKKWKKNSSYPSSTCLLSWEDRLSKHQSKVSQECLHFWNSIFSLKSWALSCFLCKPDIHQEWRDMWLWKSRSRAKLMDK